MNYITGDALQHVYIRCLDHGILFYSIEDRIVYYTTIATRSKIRGIVVEAASFMFSHIHLSVRAHSERSLSGFLDGCNSSFARRYNRHYGREGYCRLFSKDKKHSQKSTSKAKRTNIAYVFNNHVEKGLCSKATAERWSFLAYAFSDHPFSSSINRDEASPDLRKGLNLVDRRASKNIALKYSDLEKILPFLNAVEREQFIDYIIVKYALIDFSKTISHYESRDSMLIAIDSTTGGEYDIKEDYSKEKDIPYVELIELATSEGYLSRIYTMETSEKMERLLEAHRRTSASDNQLRHFFHTDFTTE